MKLASFFAQIACLLCLIAGVSSCIQEPDYSDVPEIEFFNLTKVHIIQFRPLDPLIVPPVLVREEFDSVAITISFKDGDGDLGLAGTDTLPPYSIFEVDNTGNVKRDPSGNPIPNRFHYNYFLEVERKEGTEWVNVGFLQGANFYGRYPRLNTLGNETALEGELTYSLKLELIEGAPIQEGDVLRFRLSIADRALNVSNEIISDEFVAGPN